MSRLLKDLRSACRPEAPASPQRLGVGPWSEPGTVPGSWGFLLPPSGHAGEADALVSLGGSPVALLRRRMATVQPGDRDAASLASVPLYELISPGGKDWLTSLSQVTLLEELAERLGVQ